MLLPRADSRVELWRHARKLRVWREGSPMAMDMEVIAIPDIPILELCVSNCVGSRCGLRIAFFEDSHGVIWILGCRREGEFLTEQALDTLLGRMTIVKQRWNQLVIE